MAVTVVRRSSVKMVLLEISQNSQETPVQESLFNKVAGLILRWFEFLKNCQVILNSFLSSLAANTISLPEQNVIEVNWYEQVISIQHSFSRWFFYNINLQIYTQDTNILQNQENRFSMVKTKHYEKE